MKTKFTTKLLSLLLCVCMLIPMFAACGQNEEDDPLEYEELEVIYEPYDYSEDDKFAFTATAVMTMVTDKILSAAKDKATEYASEIGNKVATKATDWLKEKLLYCLKIEPTPEPPQYTATDVYNKLTTIEDDIKDMKKSLEILKNQTNDNQYYIKYTAFVNNFSEIRMYTETPFNSLETLNGMSENSAADYTALAKSVEISLRGSGNYAVPIEQQTELSKKSLSYGNAILGDETSSSYLNTYGIFNIIRYFAERETPWEHQRKEIEDDYLSYIIYSYRNAHALVIFDLAYQMDALGVEEIYLAPDGTVIAFKYSADGTNAKWYYNAYPYQESTLTTKYATTFSNFSETPVSITDIDPNVYSQLVFLFGYYGQHQAQYNKILRALDSFTREDNETHFVLTTQNNRQYPKKLFGYSSYPTSNSSSGGWRHSAGWGVTDTTIASCTEPDHSFISWDSKDKEYTIDFDKFKNCTKSEFLAFIEIIKPYAGEKSLYNYLHSVGFEIPRASGGVNALILGIETKADDEYDNRIQSNQTWPRNFIIYWIDLDSKIKDISSDSFSKTWYSASRYYEGACNNQPNWSNKWVMHIVTPAYGKTEHYAFPACFISLPGLSTSSKSGAVARYKLDTKW